MYKKIIKLILSINNIWLMIATILSGILSCISFVSKIAKSLDKIYPQLNNDTLKYGVSFITDLNILHKEFKWLFYIAIVIFVLCLISILVKCKYNNKEIIDKVIIGHSSMSKVQFNVKTNGEYDIKELNLIEDMKDIGSNYEHIKYAINRQDKFIEEFKKSIDNKQDYGYMGIAHTPLILRLGMKIGDEIRIRLFHKKRNSQYFEALTNDTEYEPITIFKQVININSRELIVGLSTTYEIKDEELKVLNPDNKNILIFSTLELDADIIVSRKQVDYYSKYVFKEVRKLVKDNNIDKIHMVLSTSVAMTFALGQEISLNNDPHIIIYNYDRNDVRKYTWGIDLSKGHNDCLVVTNESCNHMT